VRTQIDLYRLNLILQDPNKYLKLKLDLTYEDIAVRIAQIRRQTSFQADL